MSLVPCENVGHRAHRVLLFVGDAGSHQFFRAEPREEPERGRADFAQLGQVVRQQAVIEPGTGDVLEPEDDIIGIGSGGGYALAAARALIDINGLDAEAIARRAMAIASGICVYTNDKITIEKLPA